VNGLIIDLFAGGGGASTGLEAALGRPVDIAINHDATALAVHKANHPLTHHEEADIWEAKPAELVRGRPVAILWASPDCTHFSVAKGGKPRSKKIRSLAWAVVRWARETKPAVIFLENVTEFKGWGPLGEDGKPIKAKMGKTYAAWKRKLERLGYVVDYRTIDASRYGAPTKRRRLFLVARRDGQPISWPEPTHGPGLRPFHTAAECIDWSLPCPSIFERKRPLAEKTLWRIAQGIKKFVVDNPQPFIVGVGGRAGQAGPTGAHEPVGTITAKNDRALVTPIMVTIDHSGSRSGQSPADAPLPTTTVENRHALVAPTLVQTGYGEREGQAARALDIEQPLGTVVAGGAKHALVAAFLNRHFTGVVGAQLDIPLPTVTAIDHHSLTAATLVKLRGMNHGADLAAPLPTITANGLHLAEVRAFLTCYYGVNGKGDNGQQLDLPMRTVTTKDRMGLVTVAGTPYEIGDIGLRMLQDPELLRAQFGRFALTYRLDAARTKTYRVRLIGNSVCPEAVEALVLANVPTRLQVAA
jgi:DNA (cytosine-5)-methyltransferase 1